MTPPLSGRRILVTRRPEQSGTLSRRLRGLGAITLEIATIEVVDPDDYGPLDQALRGLHRYDWLVFTSANAVRSVGERLTALEIDRASVGRAVRVASVGSSTTEAFRAHFPGGDVSLQPELDFRLEGLVAAFVARGVRGERFLLPVSDRARDTLALALRSRGAKVDSMVAYRTVTPPGLTERLASQLREGIDLATFASPSAVEGFASAAGDLATGLPAAVIGPVTERAALSAGMDVQVVASPSTEEGLLAALERHFARPPELPGNRPDESP